MHGNSNIKKKGRSWVLWSSRVWKKNRKTVDPQWEWENPQDILYFWFPSKFFMQINKKNNRLAQFKTFSAAVFLQKCGSCNSTQNV